MKLILTVTKWYQLEDGHFAERKRGDLIEVSAKVGEWLLRNGSAKHPDDETPDVDEESKREPDADVADIPADDPVDEGEQLQRPVNAANRNAWDTYARKVGVDPTQFKSKEELMAALP